MGILSPTLGKSIAVYRLHPVGVVEKTFFALVGLGSVVLFGVGWGVYSYAYTHYGPAAADSWSSPWLLAAWVIGVGCILGVSVRFFSRRWLVALHVQGIEIHRPLHRNQVIAWSQILGVATQITATTFFHHTWAIRQNARLYLQDGQTLYLREHLLGLPELVSRIKANVYPQRLPDLRLALRDGQWVGMGRLMIHRQDGIRLGGRYRTNEYAWMQVRQITIREGSLMIELPERTLSISVGEIPNLELLLQLIQEEIP